MKSLVFLATVGGLSALSLLIPAFASEEFQPEAVIEEDTNNPTLNSTGDYPLLERVSDNGNYLVQLAWPQFPLNPDNAFDLQVFFLDPNNPSGTNGTAAQPESNATGSGIEAGSITVPDTLDRFINIESYDITIYTNDGSVLWQKMDQPGRAAAPGERVTVGNYTGPVTIEITDIRPAGETATAGQGGTDSVKFSATIVPEFPLALIPLIAAAAIIVAATRLRTFRKLQWR